MGDDKKRGIFPTTRLSAVVGTRSDDAAERRRSWEAIVALYWKPAYKHLRLRWRKAPEDAEDLVQAFFARAVEREFFETFAPDRARFRTFFRTLLDRFTANEDKAEKRIKRGGGAAPLSLDFEGAEDELARAGASTASSAEEVFDRELQRVLFSRGIKGLREHCERAGRQAVFGAFQRYDLADASDRPTYDALAHELGVPVTTITNHLAYARRELRRLVLAELETVTASATELRAEARDLLGPGDD